MPAFCSIWRMIKGLKALVALRGSTRPVAGPRIQTRRDHARHQSAGYGRLDHSRPVEARPGYATYSGAHHFRRREPPRGLALGAMTYLEKSLTRESLERAFNRIEQSVQQRVKKLLVVRSDGMPPKEHPGDCGCAETFRFET